MNRLIVAGRLRSMTEKLRAVTLPSFISHRFDDRSGILKIVSTLVILFFFTLYVASGLKGGTVLFAQAFGASEQLSLIVTTLVVVSYTFLGGYLAVCWTDLIQGLLMLAALAFCGLLDFFAVAGKGVDITAVNPSAFKNLHRMDHCCVPDGMGLRILLPGFILAFLAVVVVSLLTSSPSDETLKAFDETQAEVAEA